MARQVLPIVGAVVGSFFGAPQLGFVLGSLIGNAVDPQVIKGPSLGDGQQTTSQEGQPRPIIYGTGCVGGNIIAKGELVKKKKRKRSGKGGGPVQETEHFYMTYALRICEGPIDGLIRIWEDEKLVYDARINGSLVDPAENSKYKQNFKLYLGDETQLPDPDLEVVFGVGDTPAFRGTAYIVFPNRDLTDRQGSVPNYRFEVTTSAAETSTKPNVLSYQSEYMLSGETLTYLNENENLVNADYPSIYSTSYDGNYVVFNPGGGFSINPCRIFKFNEETQIFDTPIPFEEGFYPAPNDDIVLGQAYHDVTPQFHNKSNTLFLTIGGAYQIFAIENDVAVLKTTLPRIDSYVRPSAFYFNEAGTKVIVSESNRAFIFSFDKNTYDLTYLNNQEIPNFSYADSRYAADFYNNFLVMRRSKNIDLYRFLDSTNIFELVATKQIYTTHDQNTFTISFVKNGSAVVTRTYDPVLEKALVTVYNIVPGDGLPFDYNIILDSTPIEQPEFYMSDSLSGSGIGIVSNKNREYFLVPSLSALGTSRITLYKYTTSLEKIQEISVPGSSSGRYIIMFDTEASEGIEAGPWKVSNIIKDISDRLKISIDKIDTDDVEDLNCDGLIVAQQYTGANVIRKLQEVFFFDPTEYNKKLNFLKRGKPAVKAITFEECVADSYEAERKNAIEYPRKIELMYQNARIGYVGAKAVAERISPDFAVSGTQTFESPIVLNEDKAAQAVDKMHKVSWADAEGNVKFSLPAEFQDLVVADCIAFYMRDTVQRLRIETIESADGVMNITARVDRQSAYTSAVTGLPLPDPTAPPGTITGVTVWAYLDIPALVDNNDALLYYYAGTGAAEAWHGYVMQRSDFEADFEDVGSSNNAEGVGYLTNAVSNASEHYIDNTNEVIVQMYNDVYDFESVTTEQLLNEKNAIAICRADGSAEIIQYKDAEYLENNLWKLTHLIRGRLNSKTSAHAINAQVVILDTVNAEPVNSPLLNKVLEHRAVSYDSSPEDAEIRSYEFKGRSQIEFPVDLLSVENDGTNINVSWSPRERFGTDLAPVRSINWQNYEIEISDGTTTQNLLSLLPTASFLTSDFSGDVTVNVWQINRFTGRGEVASAVINV